MSFTLPAFTPAQESLFLTLGSRALDSRLPRPFLGDTMADRIITTTGYGLDKFPQLNTKLLDRRSKVFDVAVRSKVIDGMVRRFVLRHPNAVVLDLGAGLDGRISRVDPPTTVEWYDVDFPVVADLRRKLLPQSANAHNVGADLTDPAWLRDIPSDRPAMIVADGVVLFLTQEDFVALLNRLTTHFPGGELALNAYTTHAMRTFKRSRAMRAIAGDLANPGLNDPGLLEHWVNGLTLLDEIFLTRTPEAADLPLIGRSAARLAAKSATLSRIMATVVLRYRF
ncbi:class I SAM-dependent methyltransferase [Mycolicibacterium mengxianglii]|uniref:class I SAM-dependent methyltransferase n=1 Tax=Mycolicibacterium mengxianglii TaxID=2736649 RepID=UPI0018D0F6C3|nr:class I SAM-dependent methyltransferase [Mycolicibacterium mengxianglii]